MPKTRSGKIMRRVIAGISNFADVGDTTTLANPEIVDQIRHNVQSEKVAHGEVPRELREGETRDRSVRGRVGAPATTAECVFAQALPQGGTRPAAGSPEALCSGLSH